MNILFYVLASLCITGNCVSFINLYGKIKKENFYDYVEEPLILTPFIIQNDILLAQALAEVHLDDFVNLTSYAGYLTVNENYNSNLFFWFFPSEMDYKNDPVVLWLQGGPGATSMFGLFTENGPMFLDKSGKIQQRKFSWTRGHSMLYIDNPVGTGYSFTNNIDGYARNETVIGNELYIALLQFFQLFPQLQKNNFFVTGESYAGKYVPAVCYTIHKNNAEALQKINLRGLAMGNGYSDPVNQLNYGDYLYQIGLIDTNTRKVVKEFEQKIVELIKEEKYTKALNINNELLNDSPGGVLSFIQNVTGFSNFYNYLIASDTIDSALQKLGKYIQNSKTRSKIHVGDTPFNGNSEVVNNYLADDIMRSVAPWVSELLNNYRVLIYSGQFDIIVAYPLTVNYLQNLNFSADYVYRTATRHKWYVNDVLAGYAKQAGNLTEVLVRNSGHMVPTDQPLWAFDLITRFTRNKPYY